jgi:hypothetical protein
MKFTITIDCQELQYQFQVERIPIDAYTEQFRVSAGKSHLLLESNRLALLWQGEEDTSPSYRLVRGTIADPSLFSAICTAINAYLLKYSKNPG